MNLADHIVMGQLSGLRNDRRIKNYLASAVALPQGMQEPHS